MRESEKIQSLVDRVFGGNKPYVFRESQGTPWNPFHNLEDAAMLTKPMMRLGFHFDVMDNRSDDIGLYSCRFFRTGQSTERALWKFNDSEAVARTKACIAALEGK